jgi:hypothetical protein
MILSSLVLEESAAFIFRKVETGSAPEASVIIHKITQGHNPEAQNLKLHRHENIKPQINNPISVAKWLSFTTDDPPILYILVTTSTTQTCLQFTNR